jgi:hypothetical protein
MWREEGHHSLLTGADSEHDVDVAPGDAGSRNQCIGEIPVDHRFRILDAY